ncbi:MAG: hypothetical protein OQJ77_04720 [Thiovulaceae bacterium]|nr:hypothetical protein [Sulfurimonadaceae bacterium]
MDLVIAEKDRDKVLKEISDSQNRILQIFVPTIIAVGLISIADKDKFALITLFAFFAILFASSLYISSLSYKIFRNASFLNAVDSKASNVNDGTIHWEKAFSLFSKKASIPKIIGYETKTIAVIFVMFSIVYIAMFFSMNPLLSIGLGLVLIIISIRMLLLPSKSKNYLKIWQDVLEDYNK